MTTARLRLALVTVALAMVVLLVSRVGNPLTFSGRGIPSGVVAPSSNIPDMLGRRALPAGRRAPENLSPDFRLGTLGATAIVEVGGVAGEALASGLDPEPGNTPYDGRFTFVRLRYEDGAGGFTFRREPFWAHDYPRAERNLMRILESVTYIDPFMGPSGGNILTLDDPELFKYPLAYMSEPGYWTLSEAEAEGLRSYLKKGGFVIFDDFRGSHWYNFEAQMRRVLPDSPLVELDVSHPIFHSFFEIPSLDFVQPYDRHLEPLFYGAFEDNDRRKRLLLIANYNNDIGEYWEYSDTGFIPIDLSNEAYKFGVNYMIYAFTH